jgi:hypothetical protein
MERRMGEARRDSGIGGEIGGGKGARLEGRIEVEIGG